MTRLWFFLVMSLFLGLSACASVPSNEIQDTTTIDYQAGLLESRQQGRYQQSLWYAYQLADVSGYTPSLHQQIAQLWQTMGDSQQAYYHWRQSLILSTDTTANQQAYRALAEFDIARENWAQALQWLAPLSDAGDLWAYFQSALILAPLSPNQAVRYSDMVPLEPPYEDVLLVLLPILQNQALSDANRALDVAFALAQNGYWQHAEQAFAYAESLAYPNPIASAYLALLRALQEESFTSPIQQAFQNTPDDDRVHLILATAYRIAGEWENSRYHLQIAQAINDDDPSLYVEWALLATAQGQLEEARGWYSQALRRLPEGEAGEALGVLIAELQESTSALSSQEALSQYFSNNNVP
jgi:Flp pilus assembly protein TadD